MKYHYLSGEHIRVVARSVYNLFRDEPRSSDARRIADEAYMFLIEMNNVDYYTSNLDNLRENRVFNGKKKVFDALTILNMRISEFATDAAWNRRSYDSGMYQVYVAFPQQAENLVDMVTRAQILAVRTDNSYGPSAPVGFSITRISTSYVYYDVDEVARTLAEASFGSLTLRHAPSSAEFEADLRDNRMISLAATPPRSGLEARMMRDYGYDGRHQIILSSARGGDWVTTESTNRRGYETVRAPRAGGFDLFAPYDGHLPVPSFNVDDDMRRWRAERIDAIRRNGGLFTPTTQAPAREIIDPVTAGQKLDAARRKKAHTQIQHIPTLPISPEGTAASRTWGIEVETGAGRHITTIPDGWDRRSDGSLSSAYDEEQYIDPADCPEWNHSDPDNDDFFDLDEDTCDHCGTVYQGGGGRSGDCVEVVSPIITSVHSDGLRSLTDDLEPHPVTQTAGLHVHVGADGLTAGQIRELILGYDAIEWLIEASYQRQSRGYCKRRSARELIEIARHAKSSNPTPRDMLKGDRYVTVNLNSLSRHGTIEFRAMGPVYNYDHLTRWAMFCREMVNSVARGARAKDFAKVREWGDLLAIFQRFGLEYNDALNAQVSSELATAEVVAS